MQGNLLHNECLFRLCWHRMSKRLISAQWHKLSQPTLESTSCDFFPVHCLSVSIAATQSWTSQLFMIGPFFFNLAMFAHPKISAWLQCVVSCPWCCPWSWWSRRDWKGLEKWCSSEGVKDSAAKGSFLSQAHTSHSRSSLYCIFKITPRSVFPPVVQMWVNVSH